MQYFIWFLITALYSPIVYQLYHSRWQTIDYTHAYFIMPVSLWLVWRKRTAIKAILASNRGPQIGHSTAPKEKSLLGFSLLLLGLFLFIIGWRYDYLFLSTLSLIPNLFGITIYLYGTGMAKELIFPILYLLLMVPPPLGVLDAVTLPMRYGVSAVAYLVLRSFYFPIVKEGLLFSIEGQQLFMGPACSGFRSLITMMSLGLVYIYCSRSRLNKKLILTTSIIPLALLGNLIRIILMCIITYYLGEKIAQGFFHYFSGLVIFLIMLLGMMIVETSLNKMEIKTQLHDEK